MKIPALLYIIFWFVLSLVSSDIMVEALLLETLNIGNILYDLANLLPVLLWLSFIVSFVYVFETGELPDFRKSDTWNNILKGTRQVVLRSEASLFVLEALLASGLLFKRHSLVMTNIVMLGPGLIISICARQIYHCGVQFTLRIKVIINLFSFLRTTYHIFSFDFAHMDDRYSSAAKPLFFASIHGFFYISLFSMYLFSTYLCYRPFIHKWWPSIHKWWSTAPIIQQIRKNKKQIYLALGLLFTVLFQQYIRFKSIMDLVASLCFAIFLVSLLAILWPAYEHNYSRLLIFVITNLCLGCTVNNYGVKNGLTWCVYVICILLFWLYKEVRMWKPVIVEGEIFVSRDELNENINDSIPLHRPSSTDTPGSLETSAGSNDSNPLQIVVPEINDTEELE